LQTEREKLAEQSGNINNEELLENNIDIIINSNNQTRRHSLISNLRKDKLLHNEIRERDIQPIRWDIFNIMVVLLGLVVLDQLIEGNAIVKSIIGIER
jgi:hypothetical protein